MADDSGGADAAGADSDSPKRIPQVADYFRIFSYATRWDLCTYAVAVLASLGAGITMPLMNIIFGQLVGQFTDFSTSFDDSFGQTLNRQALYIMAIFFVRWALSSINKFCFRMIGIRLSSAIRREYLEALFAQPIQAIDAMPQGAPATAISTTSNTLQLGISERLGSFLQSLVTIFGSLIIAFIWSWDLTLVTCSLVIYVVAVISFIMPRIVKGQATMAQADGEGNSIASEALANVRLVMAFSAQNRVLSSYTEWVDKSRKKGHRIAPFIGIQAGLIVSKLIFYYCEDLSLMRSEISTLACLVPLVWRFGMAPTVTVSAPSAMPALSSWCSCLFFCYLCRWSASARH